MTTLEAEYTLQKQVEFFYARRGKYLLDYFLVLIILILGSPVMALLCLLVKVTSRGPIIFRQKRIGFNNTLFTMYKFRSMSADAPKYSEKPNSSQDPRITMIGRALRKTSLDELPQLLNVLKGHMSLIGPRPEMPFLAEDYEDWENVRHIIRPGITGLWQLSPGRAGSIRDGIHLDLEYIENLSLWNDLKIFLRTFKVFFGGNTY